MYIESSIVPNYKKAAQQHAQKLIGRIIFFMYYQYNLNNKLRKNCIFSNNIINTSSRKTETFCYERFLYELQIYFRKIVNFKNSSKYNQAV